MPRTSRRIEAARKALQKGGDRAAATLAIPIAPATAFRTSILLSALALFGLGTAKVFVTRLNPLRSGLDMLAVGGLAAVVAYVIGSLLKNVGA